MINDVTPYFTVSGANELIAFMSKVFSTNLIKCDRYEDGNYSTRASQAWRQCSYA